MKKLDTITKIPKTLEVPKKKPKYAKRDAGEVKYTIIHESSKTKVNELIRVYKENPFNARVKYFNNAGSFCFNRAALFEYSGNDFEIAVFTIKFGVSITNRIYSSEKKVESIIYKSGKFWHRSENKILPLMYGSFLHFITLAEELQHWDPLTPVTTSKIFQYLHAKFPFLLVLTETKLSKTLNFNTIRTKKLFGTKVINKHVMKVSPKISEIVLSSASFKHLLDSNAAAMRGWHETLKVLDGPEHLTKEMLDSYLFVDTCKMAKTLGRKVNCRWGAKRLKDEHDTWAMEITNLLFACEVEYDLNVRAIYKAFADFSGFTVMKTNKDLLLEGMTRHHCVGTYADKVSNGSCAIYTVDGYTLQLAIESFTPMHASMQLKSNENFSRNLPQEYIRQINEGHKQTLYIKQFRGRYNESAPTELNNLVNTKIVEFVNAGGFDNPDLNNVVKTDSPRIMVAPRVNVVEFDNDVLVDDDWF